MLSAATVGKRSRESSEIETLSENRNDKCSLSVYRSIKLRSIKNRRSFGRVFNGNENRSID